MEEQFTEGTKLVAEASCSIDWVTLLTLATSIVAAIGAVVAIVVAIRIANSQKRISLLEYRMRILSDLETFVNDVMFSAEWHGSMYPYIKYSKQQIAILFDEEFADFYVQIDSFAEKYAEKLGDEDYANKKGEFKGKSPDEVQVERERMENDFADEFNGQRDRVYKKWIKV
ncbi:MAG: hypothetical protein ACI4XI_08665 [Ruminococcus sp.]